VWLSVHDRSGHELRSVEADVATDWHGLRAALSQITWVDPHTVELRPRQRAGIDLGPRFEKSTSRTDVEPLDPRLGAIPGFSGSTDTAAWLGGRRVASCDGGPR
jgi:hypothetical protein